MHIVNAVVPFGDQSGTKQSVHPCTISLDALLWAFRVRATIPSGGRRPSGAVPARGREESDVGLDLELCGVVRDIENGESVPTASTPRIARLRDSHHAVARLLARGVLETEISHITGYALSRIASLKRDPLFAELIEAYRLEQRDTQRDLEAMWLGVATDYGQHIHERLLDNPDEVPIGTALEVFKAFADRAGMAPISRSVSKNVTLNIGERLDAARSRRPPRIEIDDAS